MKVKISSILLGVVLITTAFYHAQSSPAEMSQQEFSGVESSTLAGGVAKYNAFYTSSISKTIYFPFINSDPDWLWSTTVVIQNPNNNVNQITLEYYDQQGTLSRQESVSLSPYASRSFMPYGNFSGSLKVVATEPVAAIGYVMPINNWSGDQLASYSGLIERSNKLVFSPLVRDDQCRTIVALKEMMGEKVPFKLTLRDQQNQVVYELSDEIDANGVKWYDLAEISNLAVPYRGSGTVESSYSNLGGVIITFCQNGAGYAYEGIAKENALRFSQPVKYTLFLPRLVITAEQQDHFALQLFNSAQSLAITIVEVYSNNPTPISYKTFTIPANQFWEVPLSSQTWSIDPGVYSAVIASDQPIDAFVTTYESSPYAPIFDTTQADSGNMDEFGSSYLGIVQPGTKAYLPYMRKTAGEGYTSFTIFNADLSFVDVKISYFNSTGEKISENLTNLPANSCRLIDLSMDSQLPWDFIGSAIVEASGKIAVVGSIWHNESRQIFYHPSSPASLSIFDPEGLPTKIEFPKSASSTSFLAVGIPYLPSPNSDHSILKEFELRVYSQGVWQSNWQFSNSLQVTIEYSDQDISEVAERALRLQRWDTIEHQWVEGSCGDYQRDLGNNQIRVPICQSGRYALTDLSSNVYLPLIIFLR